MNHCRNATLRASSIAAALLGAGCVAAPSPPMTELATARAAIIQAERAGAQQVAPAELNTARELLAEAQELAPTDEALARWRAKQAQSDARLAEATAQSAKAHIAIAALDRNRDAASAGADLRPIS